jgi:2-polyprenyl-3-methyl-5-hydroxy-6-metoxy-1,4-benzoquinol methylase
MKTFSKQPGKEKTTAVSCNLCGADEFRIVSENQDYRFVTCRRCGLVYQNPLPDSGDVLSRYDEEYFSYERENENNFFTLMKLGLDDVDFYSHESSLINRGLFLDVGCATGLLIAYMRERGWNVKGVEVCRQSAEYGIRNRNLDISIGTLEESAIPDNSCSVVHCSHVIEHVPDPAHFFKVIKRVLQPNGLLVLTTPNIDGFQSRLFGQKWRSMIADHLYLFSKKTIQHYCATFGFHVIRHKTWGGLAAGTAPLWIKAIMDTCAKKLDLGDVMIYLTRNEKSEN